MVLGIKKPDSSGNLEMEKEKKQWLYYTYFSISAI